jgi:hypothetical protein
MGIPDLGIPPRSVIAASGVLGGRQWAVPGGHPHRLLCRRRLTRPGPHGGVKSPQERAMLDAYCLEGLGEGVGHAAIVVDPTFRRVESRFGCMRPQRSPGLVAGLGGRHRDLVTGRLDGIEGGGCVTEGNDLSQRLQPAFLPPSRGAKSCACVHQQEPHWDKPSESVSWPNRWHVGQRPKPARLAPTRKPPTATPTTHTTNATTTGQLTGFIVTDLGRCRPAKRSNLSRARAKPSDR